VSKSPPCNQVRAVGKKLDNVMRLAHLALHAHAAYPIRINRLRPERCVRAGLEIRRTVSPYRGFESHPLRQYLL
jgi:hypothetical protein